MTIKESLKQYGIPRQKYEEIKKAQSLQGIYNMDEQTGNMAYSLSEKLHLPLEDTFRMLNESIDEGNYHG